MTAGCTFYGRPITHCESKWRRASQNGVGQVKTHRGHNSDHSPSLSNSLKPFGMPRPILNTYLGNLGHVNLFVCSNGTLRPRPSLVTIGTIRHIPLRCFADRFCCMPLTCVVCLFSCRCDYCLYRLLSIFYYKQNLVAGHS